MDSHQTEAVVSGSVQMQLLNLCRCRLEICQKFTRPDFFGKQFYTIKMRKLRLFLLKIKQRKFQYKSFWSFFCVEIEMRMLIVKNLLIHKIQ